MFIEGQRTPDDLLNSTPGASNTAVLEQNPSSFDHFRQLETDDARSRIELIIIKLAATLRVATPIVLLIIGDLAALMGAGVFAVWLRHLLEPAPFRPNFVLTLLTYSMIVSLAYALFGLYNPVPQSGPEELRRISLTTTAMAVMMFFMTYLTHGRLDIHTVTAIIAWFTALFTVPLLRAAVRGLFSRSNWWGRKAIILSQSTETANRLVDKLRKESRHGLRPIAILTSDSTLSDEVPHGLRQLRGPGPALAYAQNNGINYAIVATTELNDPETLQLVRRYENHFKHWLFVPYFSQHHSLWVRSRDFDGMLGLELTQSLLNRSDKIAKFCLDMLITTVGGLIALPLLVLIGIAIKIESRGPALYKQVRIGKNGKCFYALKFRSMARYADKILADTLENHPGLKKEWEETQKLKNDPRVTRVGKFLRRTSLDELPQLINVLRGEMSLVGPRPIVKSEITRYDWVWPLYKRVAPGITGQWQISGRNDVTYSERTKMDAYYVRNWSVWLDLYILARTVLVVLKRRGAY